MKTASLCILAAISFPVCAGVYTGRHVVISETDFAFQFEDETLSTTNMSRIAEDVALIHHSWTNFDILYQETDGFDGVVADRRMEGSPYADANLELPKYFTIAGGTNRLFVSKALSDAYIQAFATLDSDTNILCSARAFVEGLSSNRLDATQSNEVYRLVLYPRKPLSAYAAKRDAIIGQLKEQQYMQPCLLAFFHTEPGANGFPLGATWMKIPAIYQSSMGGAQILGFMYAIWHENMWRIYPIGL